MKRYFISLLTAIMAVFAVSCEYDDSALIDRLDDLEGRVQILEQLCNQMNTNISSLQQIVNALQSKDYVKTVTPIAEGDKTIGYTITFEKGEAITLYNGKDGKDGADGEDGYTPVIGVSMDEDGTYYWTLDGKWLTDEDGNKISASAKDGADGKDGVIPELQIKEGYWYVSYDGGENWERLGRATGASGSNGDSFFKSVNTGADYVELILSDGTSIVIPMDPSLDDEDKFRAAVAKGGTVTLEKDITLDKPLEITKDVTINLNEKKISSKFSDKTNDVVINNTATLKLIGGGTITNTATNGAAIITNSGKLVLDNVTIQGAPIADGGYPSYAIYTSGDLTVEEGTTVSSDRGAIYMEDGANVTVNGGNIKVTNTLGNRVLTAHVIYASGSNSKLAIYDGNLTMDYNAAKDTGASVICPAGATINIYGGNFRYAGETGGQSGIFQNYMGYGAPVRVYGGTYNDATIALKKNGTYVNIAKGYKHIVDNGIYYVVAEEVSAVVSTPDDIAAALTTGEENINVVLADDIDLPISSLGTITGGSGEYKLGGDNTKNIIIDLNGKKLNITTTYWSNLGAKNDAALFTIKNGSMTSSQPTGTWNSYDLTFSNCDYVFEDVVFDKAIAFDNAGKSVSLKNVTINETHDYYAMWITAAGQSVTIDGLKINSSGRGIKIDEQYVSTPAKVTLNVNNATFKTAKKAAIMVKSVAGAEINVSKLDISGVAADNKNAVWVDADAAQYADKVVVNGATKVVEK